jgi:hypothetical protein
MLWILLEIFSYRMTSPRDLSISALLETVFGIPVTARHQGRQARPAPRSTVPHKHPTPSPSRPAIPPCGGIESASALAKRGIPADGNELSRLVRTTHAEPPTNGPLRQSLSSNGRELETCPASPHQHEPFSLICMRLPVLACAYERGGSAPISSQGRFVAPLPVPRRRSIDDHSWTPHVDVYN